MKLIEKIEQLNQISSLYQQDFLLSWKKSGSDLRMVFEIAGILREMRHKNISPKVFDSGLAISMFRDPSTHTRLSYSSAANMLGLTIHDTGEFKSQLAYRQNVGETANLVSYLSDFIGIRDKMYFGEGHKYMQELANAATEGFESGVLDQRPGVINLQCDMDHPTQSMADALYLREYLGKPSELRGKKFVMSWAYSPSCKKPLSVPQGIISMMSRFGMEVELCHPEGYDLTPEVVEVAKNMAKYSDGSFKISHSMDDAVKDADFVYAKNWAPYHILEERTRLLKENDKKGLEELEKSGIRESEKYKNWEYNEEKEKLTKNGNSLFMHCLPADVSGVSCDNGEVSAGIFEKFKKQTYLEASYKPYIIAAMMLSYKFEHPALILKEILGIKMHRIGL